MVTTSGNGSAGCVIRGARCIVKFTGVILHVIVIFLFSGVTGFADTSTGGRLADTSVTSTEFADTSSTGFADTSSAGLADTSVTGLSTTNVRLCGMPILVV